MACRYCGGDGYINHSGGADPCGWCDPVECYVCGGTGKTACPCCQVVGYQKGDPEDPEYVECHVCGDEKEVDCEECGGEGNIPPNKEEVPDCYADYDMDY